MTDLPSLKTLLPCFLLIGALTAYVAHVRQGRKPLPWFFLGFFFGLLALLVLLLLPKKEAPALQPLFLHQSITRPLPIKNTTPLPEELPMTKELWYFLDEAHQQVGPVTFKGLKNYHLEGKLSDSSYVWNPQLKDWKRLEALPEYFSLIQERENS